MKKSTFENRIKKNNISKSSIGFKTLIKMLESTGTQKHFINISNRNTAKDYCSDVVHYGHLLGIKVVRGHDWDLSPRGGLLGDYVCLPNKKQMFK